MERNLTNYQVVIGIIGFSLCGADGDIFLEVSEQPSEDAHHDSEGEHNNSNKHHGDNDGH